MKKINVFVAIAILTISISCSKKEDQDPTPTLPTTIPPAPEVNPLAGYLTTTRFGEKTTPYVDQETYLEFGLSFKPIVNGKITAVIVKIPNANTTLSLTIWDRATGTVLKTEFLNYPTAGLEVTKAITALDIVAGKEYMITINSNDYYLRSRTDISDVTYPVAVGDISITGFYMNSGTDQVMPYFNRLEIYLGDVSFKFQKS